MPVSASDRDILIRTVIGEAGDQPDAGKAAVAHVVMNRMANGRWGSTPSDVVLSRGQFEPWSTRARELMGIDQKSPQYQRVAAIVDGVLSGQTPDPTNGATHFLDPKIVRARRGGSLPDWAQGPGLTIGDHAFYAPKKGASIARPDNSVPFPKYGQATPATAQEAIDAALKSPIAKNLQSQRLGFADEDQVPDLLGQWVKHDATNAPANARSPAAAPSPAPAAAPSDDLLGAWVKADEAGATPATQAPPGEEPKSRVPAESGIRRGPGWSPPFYATGPAHEAAAAAKGAGANARVADTFGALETKPPAAPLGPETMPQAVNRWMAENQGDTWTERGIRLGAGAIRGVGDLGDTLAQGIGAAGEGGANVLQRLGVISPESAGAVRGWHAGINRDIAADRAQYESAAGNSDLATIGRIGGQVLGTAGPLGAAGRGVAGLLRGSPIAGLISRPVIGAAIGGAGAGAGAAALTSAASDEPLSDQVTGGALMGGIVGPASRGVGELGRRIFGGGVDAETAALARAARDQYGIGVGPGQISANPMVRFLDSVLQRVPFTGYGPHVTEQQGAFNRAVGRTFGEDTDKITTQTISRAQRRIGGVFDDVAARTGPIAIDDRFVTHATGILADARSVLPQSEASVIENQLRNITSKVDRATGTLSPETYQALTRKGAPLERAMSSKDPNIRYYAGQVRDALDDLMQRSAPADAVQDLIQARAQYKALKTVQPLAKKATTGDVSPANLLSLVNKSYSGDGGQLGELGRIGQRFLKEPPSSGTAERLWLMQHGIPLASGLAGVGSVGAATYFDPDKWERNAALGVGGLIGARTIGGMLRGNTLPGSAIANLLINRGGRQPAPAVNPFQPTISPSIAALLSRAQPAPALPPP